MKTTRIKLSTEAENTYKELSSKLSFKTERMLFDAINKKVDLLKSDVHYGNPIAKKLIPIEYKIDYGITNLFRIELPGFWRLLYTITNGAENEIVVVILDIIDHKVYDKKFGYRGN